MKMIRKIGVVVILMMFLFGGAYTIAAEKKVEGKKVEGEKQNVVEIRGGIDKAMADRVIYRLWELDQVLPPGENIVMVIWFSPGGEFWSSLAICDAMKRLNHDVATIVVGYAYSGAAVIGSSGTPGKRYVPLHGHLMIHPKINVINGFYTERGLEEYLQVCKKESLLMYYLLSENTGKDVKQIIADLEKEEVYFTAEEAIEYGLADKIFGPEEIKLFHPIK